MESYFEAQTRIPTQKEKIVSILREAGDEGITNAELAKVCLRYGARLQELYKEGYEITLEHLNNGLYKYILKKVPGGIYYFPNAEDEIFDAIDGEQNNVSKERLKELLEEHDFYIIRKPGWFKRKMNLH